MKEKKLIIRRKNIIALITGIIILIIIVRISNHWDTTKDIDYLKQETVTTVEQTGEGGRNVFICDNPNSHLYHYYKDCEELQKCPSKIIEIKKAGAEDLDRKECKDCGQ